MPELLVPSRTHSRSSGYKCQYPVQQQYRSGSWLHSWQAGGADAGHGEAECSQCPAVKCGGVVGQGSSFPPVPMFCLCPQGSQKELLNLTQQDYVNRIEELNQSLKDAWASDQKVKALKIVIQVRLREGVWLQFSV